MPQPADGTSDTADRGEKTRIDPQSQQRTLYCLYPGDFNNHSTPPFKYE